MSRPECPRARSARGGRVRLALLALLAAASSAAALPTSAGAAGAATATQPCVGLTCPGDDGGPIVPEATGGPFPVLSGYEAVSRSTPGGFYDFLPGDGQPREVVYLIPPGGFAATPESVRRLPLVASFAAPGGHPGFATSATIVYGPVAAITIPADRLEARGARSAKKRARAATPDAWGCEESSFCLYDDTSFTGAFLTLQGSGTGWFNLSAYGFDNRAASMRNRRGNDSLLAGSTGGGGSGYCADSHSSDATFGDNAIGNNNASSSALVPDDVHC